VNALTEDLGLSVLGDVVVLGDPLRSAMDQFHMLLAVTAMSPIQAREFVDIKGIGISEDAIQSGLLTDTLQQQPTEPREMIKLVAAVMAETHPGTARWWGKLATWADTASDRACARCVEHFRLVTVEELSRVPGFAHDFMIRRTGTYSTA
jgi:hypothetical protein